MHARPSRPAAETTNLDELRLECQALSPVLTLSLLDGYLAAVAFGPNFVMPDLVLRWARNIHIGAVPKITANGLQRINNLIIRLYQAVNDALNDQGYMPRVSSVDTWCRVERREIAGMLHVPVHRCRHPLGCLQPSGYGDARQT